jgi:hypothetical protein
MPLLSCLDLWLSLRVAMGSLISGKKVDFMTLKAEPRLNFC